MKKRNVVIAQSGGPTMVINQSLVGAVMELRKSARIGKIWGARHGIEGILGSRDEVEKVGGGKKLRVRADAFGYLQRSFPGVASEVDQNEAYLAGVAAAKAALAHGCASTQGSTIAIVRLKVGGGRLKVGGSIGWGLWRGRLRRRRSTRGACRRSLSRRTDMM